MGCPANGSRHSMALVAETVAGTTPATPDFTPIRQTGTTLALTKEALQSNELRADRQIADMRHGNKQVGGDISTELSFGGAFGPMPGRARRKGVLQKTCGKKKLCSQRQAAPEPCSP